MKKKFRILMAIGIATTATNTWAENPLEIYQKLFTRWTTKPIEDIGERMQKRALETKYINENPDLLDMPPWDHENKWNKISKPGKECWFHKKSLKKVCR